MGGGREVKVMTFVLIASHHFRLKKVITSPIKHPLHFPVYLYVVVSLLVTPLSGIEGAKFKYALRPSPRAAHARAPCNLRRQRERGRGIEAAAVRGRRSYLPAPSPPPPPPPKGAPMMRPPGCVRHCSRTHQVSGHCFCRSEASLTHQIDAKD